MPVHLAAAYESVDQTLDNVKWNELADGEDFFTTTNSGDGLRTKGGFNRLIAAYAGSASMEVARFRQVPGLERPVLGRYIHPVSGTAEPGSPPAWMDLRGNPIDVSPDEDLNYQVKNDSAGSGEDVYGLAWFTDGQGAAITPAAGDVVVRYTGATAGVKGNWVNVAITLDNALEAGEYLCYGAQCIDTEVVAWRFPQAEPIGGSGNAGRWKPGGLGADAVADLIGLESQPWWNGQLGGLVRFEHDDPPTIQVLANGTGNSQEGFLRLRKVA